ncbi:MAG: hypothetical protein H0T84_13105 [Tatlockia sp.]|nr:hypothetical protein [Tatlockia sp.]
MSKSKHDRISEGLELSQNTITGASIGGISNLVVNNFRNKPLGVYPGALIGGLLFFGVTKTVQNMDFSDVFDETWHSDRFTKK